MPKQQAQLFAHTVVTNHRIVAREGEPLPQLPSSSRLIFVDGKAARASPLVLLDANRQILLSHPDPDYEQRYSQLLTEAEKTDPDSIIVLRVLAKIGIQQGSSEGRRNAIRDLERVVKMKSATPDDRFALGEALVMSGHVADGIAVLQRAVPLDPYNPLGYEALIMSYLAAGRPANAIKVTNHAREIFPENRILRMLQSKLSQAATAQ
jgi:tetratricopeptide (TPR) repeat protein